MLFMKEVDLVVYSPILFNKQNYCITIPGTAHNRTVRPPLMVSSISNLYNYEEDDSFGRFLMPNSSSNSAVLKKILSQEQLNFSKQNAVSNQQFQRRITISSFQNKLPVLQTKQHPRIIYMYGSDGNKYQFLLKGREDLRMDERIMQLFELINTIFSTSPTLQGLQIRKYPVIPLSYMSGLIGWLNSHDTYNSLVKEYRKRIELRTDYEFSLIIEDLYPSRGPDQSKVKYNVYKSLTTMQKFDTFNYVAGKSCGRDLADILWLESDSTDEWYDRRKMFTQTNAVMSMVFFFFNTIIIILGWSCSWIRR
jgi:phosphatidylinositol kinase/protein kinase (PI-3  family)